MSMVLGMNCPHCRTRAKVRTSMEVTATMREVYFGCTNLACGHTWVATLEAVRTLSRSAIERPDVLLPISPRSECERLPEILYPSPQRSLL